jgi:hypothetical protein
MACIPGLWHAGVAGVGLADINRRKPSSFEEYWLASKGWERKGLSLGTARALANAGFLTVDDLRSAHDLELETIPRLGPKSLAILYGLIGRAMPGAPKSQTNVSKRGRRRMSSLSMRRSESGRRTPDPQPAAS